MNEVKLIPVKLKDGRLCLMPYHSPDCLVVSNAIQHNEKTLKQAELDLKKQKDFAYMRWL